MGGEGLAFWYTKKPLGLGPMYGSEDKWEGMGIFFDTADQLENVSFNLWFTEWGCGHTSFC